MAENFCKQYGCKYYSAMPTNLYWINNNFHVENSYVILGLIARMTNAMEKGEKEFAVLGTGNPKREFLYVDESSHLFDESPQKTKISPLENLIFL